MLYTRKGDQGTTKVLDSDARFTKASNMAEALGTLDELNSYLGLCKVKARQVQEGGVPMGKRTLPTSDILFEVQQNLFIVQAEVAGAKKKLGKAKVTRVEGIVNVIEKELPPITTFTVAGGTELAAMIDVARTMARRAERRIVAVKDAGERKLSPHTLSYMNRLSSLLFALARFTNHRSGIKEESPTYR